MGHCLTVTVEEASERVERCSAVQVVLDFVVAHVVVHARVGAGCHDLKPNVILVAFMKCCDSKSNTNG